MAGTWSLEMEMGERKTAGKRLRRFFVSILLAGVLLVSTPQPSHACMGVIGGFATAALAKVTALIELAYLRINNGFNSLYQPHTLFANQTTNNTQNKSNIDVVRSDRKVAQLQASEVAEVRSKLAIQMSSPSRIACGQSRLQQRYTAMQDDFKASYSDYEIEDIEFSFNHSTAAGRDTKDGALGTLKDVWDYRCGKYADPAAMNIDPAKCAGASDPEYINLDIRPLDAILAPESFEDSDREQAARDSMRMLIQLTPDNPLRGSALSRNDGQNIYVMRNKELARMSLARSILNSAIADRVRHDVSTGAGALPMPADTRELSRRERFREIFDGQGTRDPVTGSLKTEPAKKLTEMSGQPENGNVQTFAGQLDSYKMMLLRLIQLTEQMVAVEAVRLASVVDETRVDSGVNLRMLPTR